MSFVHAVGWLDHYRAQVLQFDASQNLARQVASHLHYTRQQGSRMRCADEFYGEICDALAGSAAVLVAGAHEVQGDFHRFVDKHRPSVGARILDWQTLDHPTGDELVAFARRHFSVRGVTPVALQAH